jgi:hypothetical protein
MGMVFNLPAVPSVGASFGAGMGEGFSSASKMMVNAKLNEMLYQKQRAMQHAEWGEQGKAIAEAEGGTPEEQKRTIDLVTMLSPDGYYKFKEIGGLQRLNNMYSETTGGKAATPGMAPETPEAAKQQFIPGITNPQYQQGAGGQANVPNIKGLPPAEKQEITPQVSQQAEAQGTEDRYRIATLSPTEFEKELAQSGYTEKQKEAARKARTSYINTDIAQQGLALKQQIANFDQTRKTKESINKSNSKFIDDTIKSSEAADTVLKSLNNMEEIRKRGNLGAFSWFKKLDPKVRQDKASYDTEASNVINLYRSMFPRGITTPEFKRITEEWTPSSNFTDATNEGRESVFKRMVDQIMKKNDLLLSLQKPDGSYPANVQSIVNKKMHDEEKSLKQELLKGPGVAIGDITQKLDPASKFPAGARFQEVDQNGNPTGYVYVGDGKNWKKEKE